MAEEDNYYFVPVENITAYEVALILEKLDVKLTHKLITELPIEARRHFPHYNERS